MYIEESSLYKFVKNSWTFYQAQDEYYTGQIETISIFKGIKDGKQIYKVKVDILDGRKQIDLRFEASYSGMVLSVHCSCKKVRNVGCVHLVYACRAINELQPELFPFRINYREYLEEKRRQRQLEMMKVQMQRSSDSLFSMMDRLQKKNIAEMMVDDTNQIRLKMDNMTNGYDTSHLDIGLKIGIEKMFRVKDIKALINGFSSHELYPLGKSQSVQLDKDRLDKNSLKIFEFFSRFSSINDWRRSAFLTGHEMDAYYRLLESIPSSMHDLYIFKHKIILPLKIKENPNFYYIQKKQFPITGYYYGEKHLYVVNYRDIHQYEIDPKGQLVQLVRLLDEDNILYVEKGKMQQFYNQCIRPNREYIDCDYDFSEYEMEVSDITLYSNLQDSQIRIWGSFKQNGEERKLFDENEPVEIQTIEAIISHYASSIEDYVAVFKTRGANLNNFLDTGLPLLMEQAKVYVSEELIRLKERKKVNLSIGVQLQNNLLEMNIDSEDVSRDELIHILNAYRRKKKFYRLKNGDMIDLEQDSIKELDEWSNQMNLNSKDLQKDVITKPAYQMKHLEGLEDSIEFRKDESINQYAKNLENLSKDSIELSDKYKDLLRDYQKAGIQWLHHLNQMELNGILADDMGLGKTIQVLVYLENFVSKKKSSLIVCPSSLMYNWQSEIKKFDIQIDSICVTGSQSERIEKIKEKHELYITTYDYLKRDVEYYKKTSFEYIILDEAQYIKNPKTQNAQSIKSLKSKHKLALTGTPIENSLTELWSIFDFLLPGYLYTLPYFVKMYEKPIRLENDEVRQEHLKNLVAPFILRRTKQEVLTDLPDKQEKEMWLDFNKEEKNLYLANLAKANEALQEQLKLEHMDTIEILAMMTRLRQICCEPRLIYDNIETMSTKLEMCIDLIETLKENNKKVLLFSSFTSIFDFLIKEFDQRGIKYHLITGKVLKQQRQKEVDEFQSDDSDVFLISLKAGGTGLNLTAAQAVIHFDPWWNVSAQNQATDRAYRIGQTKNVLVYQLLMKNTIEEKIFEMQKRKKEMSDIFVENSKGGVSSLTKEELKDLFTYEI